MVGVHLNRSQGGVTMAAHHRRADKELVQQILLDDPEFLRRIVEHISNISPSCK
jgi:hypothetical protein